jgi:DNA polymerase III delta prime subunit
MRDEFLWVEKYRPRKVEDTILPYDLKQTFQKFVDQENVPNLILAGSAGVGKTTIAKAMLEELECDYIVINGSMNGNIDTLRNDIMSFASSVSLQGGRKYVILDEADYLNANSTQPALRNFMEEYSRNCGFILTCNFVNRIIEPLHSRCSVIEFKLSKCLSVPVVFLNKKMSSMIEHLLLK